MRLFCAASVCRRCYRRTIRTERLAQNAGRVLEDPAGDDELVERALYGIPIDSIDLQAKDDDGGFLYSRDGKAGFLIDKRCVKLRKALAGGYHFRRVSVGAGQERFKDVPMKDMHSHCADALQYCLLGSEHSIMTKRPSKFNIARPTVVRTLDFDVFAN